MARNAHDVDTELRRGLSVDGQRSVRRSPIGMDGEPRCTFLHPGIGQPYISLLSCYYNSYKYF